MNAVHRPMILAALAVFAWATPSRAEGLAVKTGLWETSSSGAGLPQGMMPQIPADQLARLTPQQQAMVQQGLAAASGSKSITRKMCVTQAMLDKGFSGPDTNQNCKRTLVSSSASAMEVRMVCTGDHPGTGTLHLDAVDAKTVNGTLDMEVMMRGMSVPMHRTIQGRWLSADCGTVKPAN
jgi:hypothetical protein